MHRINWPLAAAVFIMAWLLVFLYSVNFSYAHDHKHPDGVVSDRVGKFYESWKRPPQRMVSCCNLKDCYAAQIRRNPNGGLEYLHKWSGTWAKLPSRLIEHNQPDPRESPNTENHVCASEMFPDVVYCAVLASGT